MVDGVARARECYRRRAWRDAWHGFCSRRGELGVEDLERLAVSAYLVGRNDESDEAWAKAYRRRLDEGDIGGALRCAFWLGFRLVNSGELSEANAWVSRIERLVPATPAKSTARARLDYLTGLRAALAGDFATAGEDLENSAATATRDGDDELAALARLSLGRVRIFLGDFTAGVRLLDDAMLVVGSEPISPIAVGDSYCTAIDACHDLVDVRRGQTWTDGLTRWCDEQPDLVPFAGVCQVHRAEFLQLKGAWVEAMAQAGRAQARLAQPYRQLAYGAALYQRGELHRLLGESDRAEACFRDASAAGRDPQPGLALLRLRQGRPGDAAQAIDRAVAEVGNPVARSWLLPAYVEIMIAADRVAEARNAASELAVLAASLGSPLLGAIAKRAASRSHDPVPCAARLSTCRARCNVRGVCRTRAAWVSAARSPDPHLAPRTLRRAARVATCAVCAEHARRGCRRRGRLTRTSRRAPFDVPRTLQRARYVQNTSGVGSPDPRAATAVPRRFSRAQPKSAWHPGRSAPRCRARSAHGRTRPDEPPPRPARPLRGR